MQQLAIHVLLRYLGKASIKPKIVNTMKEKIVRRSLCQKDEEQPGSKPVIDHQEKVLQQSQQLNNFDWHQLRRHKFPARRPHSEEKTPCTAIPLECRMKQNEGQPSFQPPEATLCYHPATMDRTPPTYLKRFSGKKIAPADNFVQIYNGDGRQLFFDARYPWSCIGRLATRNGHGTATLVGENFIVTAAHVLAGLWTPGQPLTETIVFTPAMNRIPPANNAASILGNGFDARVVAIAAWKDVHNGDVAGYDMAICKLDKPLGQWLGYFGSRNYDDDWEDENYWQHIGYPFDLDAPDGFKPCFQSNVAVHDDDEDDYGTIELNTRADIASGQSGGPLFGFFKEGPHLIGVLSGREVTHNLPKNDFLFWDLNEAVFAGGTGLNALIRWGRNHWAIPELFPQRAFIGTLSRNPNQMDLFAVAQDGTVRSAWWNGDWNHWFRVGSGAFTQNAPVATILRNPNQMDLFAVGLDGGVYSAWWNGSWHDWFRIGSFIFAQKTAIATICRNANQMDLFAVGLDGGLYSAWWNGNWNNWFRIGTGVFAQNTPIATICRNANQMDLFAVGLDGGVYSAWWNGSWNNWFRIGAAVFAQNTPIATICRNDDQMDLFAVGLDGGVYSTWWNGSWNHWFRIGGAVFAQNTPIATICRNADQMDLFAVGLDGRAYSAWWNGTWHSEWFPIGTRVFAQNTPIATICRNANQMDLFAVGLDGCVYSAWWDGTWHDWFLIP